MKKKTVTMWALWNYSTLFAVKPLRKYCRDEANESTIGGKEKADAMFRSGAFRITKVRVTEI